MQLQRVKYRDLERFPGLKINYNFKQEFTGSAPAPFIGRVGYPHVTVGILSPQQVMDTIKYDSPRYWSAANTSVLDVASFRYGLVNSRLRWNVQQVQGKFLDICKEVGMASRAVDVEVKLKQKPILPVSPEREIIPFGPQGDIVAARVTANTAVDARVEKIVRDTDLKAASGIHYLFQNGFEEHFLSKLISVGNLGLGKNRKLVPTRWSITAIDDTLGKQLIAEIKDFSLGEYSLYFGGGWGNYYLVLFFPEIWSYELFETYLESPVNPWSEQGYKYSTDYENYGGRKSYAEECAGGYYACRLPILEKMKQLKRQHSVLALRFITSEYTMPLGVWVCREATRKSLQEKPLYFASQELMLQYAQELLQSKFGTGIRLLLQQSKLLNHKRQQKKLSEL